MVGPRYPHAMEVEYENDELERLEEDGAFSGGYDQGVVRAFRMRMQLIRAAADERAFYAMKSLHFEKLKGDRAEQYSMRLNSQWRLILKLVKQAKGKTVVVVSIVDYH